MAESRLSSNEQFPLGGHIKRRMCGMIATGAMRWRQAVCPPKSRVAVGWADEFVGWLQQVSWDGYRPFVFQGAEWLQGGHTQWRICGMTATAATISRCWITRFGPQQEKEALESRPSYPNLRVYKKKRMSSRLHSQTAIDGCMWGTSQFYVL